LYLDSNNFYINSTLGSDVGVYTFVTTWTTIDIHGATIVCKLISVSPVNLLPNSYTYFLGSAKYFINLMVYNYSDWVQVPACNLNTKYYPVYINDVETTTYSDFTGWYNDY
jgi:hypothetical protein